MGNVLEFQFRSGSPPPPELTDPAQLTVRNDRLFFTGCPRTYPECGRSIGNFGFCDPFPYGETPRLQVAYQEEGPVDTKYRILYLFCKRFL